MKLDRGFYERQDVTAVAIDLLGKQLVTQMNGEYSSGIIVETEAYCGAVDRASHAFRGRTPRNNIMFGRGGYSYVYLCYGIHHLFNVVTNQEEVADAVLIRALEPVDGLDLMASRRKMDSRSVNLTSGPGKLSVAMGIQTVHNGLDLMGHDMWIEEAESVEPSQVTTTTRIGVDYAGDDAKLPWRFLLTGNRFVSKKA